jgi:tetratricopeptide (TPR) repeat protein
MLLPDTVASVRVYKAVAPIERLINRPDFQAMVDFGDADLAALDAGLKRRPDDLQAQRLRVLFLEMLARRTLLQNFLAGQEKKPNEVQSLYMDLNVVSLASKILDPRISEAVRVDARREVVDSQKIYPWSEDARSMLKQSPFVLSMATFVAANDLLMGQLPESQEAILQSRFAEPHAASALFQLGNLLFLADRVAECRQCWAQSIAASESFRPQILLRVSDKLGPETALRWFSPESYETSVRTALGVQRSSGLQVLLFKYASELWKTRQPRITEEIVLVRSLHLQATGAAEEAIRCLAEYLAEYPSSVVVRKGRARMLEKAGLNGEAYDEWLRVKSFSPADTESDESLERLIQLPPTTHFSPDGQLRSSSRNAVCVCMFIISLNLSAGVECLLASSVVNFLQQNSLNPPGFSGDRGCSESS